MVVEETGGGNLLIYMSHTPDERIMVQRADRKDLLVCLLKAEGVDQKIIDLLDTPGG